MIRRGFNQDRQSFLKMLLLSSSIALATSAWAQDESEDQEEDGQQSSNAELDKVTILGSRIKRTDIAGAQPVIVIDNSQMTERGQLTVFDALSDLSVNNGFKFEGPESALFTPDVQTINLRGFGVGNTLTLINGRRIASYPAAYQSNTTVFNFGAIPVAAVERIEILATGASAIYGSDAVAGVVNIVLRSDVDDNTINFLYNTPTETKSNRDDIRVQFLTGKTFDRGSFSLAFEYQDREPINGGDLEQFDSQLDYPFGNGVLDRQILTLDWFRSAFGIFPRYREPIDITGAADGDAACAQANAPVEYAFREGAGNFCGHDDIADTNFRNEKEAYSIFLNGQMDVGDNGMQAFADFLYYTSESRSKDGDIIISEDILDVTAPDTIGFGFFDWYLAQRDFTEEELGREFGEFFEDESFSLSLGARGPLGSNHDWEVSVNRSEYTYESERPWWKWREVIDTFLGTWHGVGFFGDDWWSGGTLGENLGFGLGDPSNLYGSTNSAAVLNAIGTQTYGNDTSSSSINFSLTGDVTQMKYGPLSYALVLEYEDQDFEFIPDELIQQRAPTTDVNGDPITGLTGSGWYRLTGYQGEGDRQRYAVGGELRVPLHDTFTLNLAARFDDYDSGSTSFGSDITPSASFEWRPTRNLLVRGGYTESFRAPDMAQVFVSTGFFTSDFDFVSCYEQAALTDPNVPPPQEFDTGDCDSSTTFARRIGAQELGDEDPLDAETGFSEWLGFSWEIMDNLTFQADWSRVNLEDRVLQESTQELLDDEWECFRGNLSGARCDQVATRIIRQTDSTTGLSFIDEFNVTPFNQFEEEVDSLDLRLFYDLNTDFGSFSFVNEYTHLISHDQILEPGSPPIDLRDDPIQGGWDFRSRYNGSVTYRNGDFATTLTVFRRGTTTVRRCTSQTDGANRCTNGDHRVGPYITWNWTGQYNVNDNFAVRARVVNLFDQEPPVDDTHLFFDEPWYNIFVYSGAGIGRQVALEAEYSF